MYLVGEAKGKVDQEKRYLRFVRSYHDSLVLVADRFIMLLNLSLEKCPRPRSELSRQCIMRWIGGAFADMYG